MDSGTEQHSSETMARADGRRADEPRRMGLRVDVAPNAGGSVLAVLGGTRVICAAMLEEGVPRWMREQQVEGGWLTAEYSLLPYATSPRKMRESSMGRISGRTMEIQRMIGRALRAVTDLDALGARTLWVDCDVLSADGGTRTAAISGAYVAAVLALRRARDEGRIAGNPFQHSVAAIGVGVVGGRALLDLTYAEDAIADVDMNVVMTGDGRLIEVQGGAEHAPFTEDQWRDLLTLARRGTEAWCRVQRETIGE
jgi:ribonuclease PH